jgi:succinyl-CoA synthetase alpha subunit
MSIWVNNLSRVLVQGISGKYGSYHTRLMRAYGTNIVGGVTPGKGGEQFDGLLVFDTVIEAKQATAANVSIIFVPAPSAAGAIYEAAEAEIEVIVCITEHIPVQDMLQVTSVIRESPVRLVGPNCPGIIAPGQTKIGIMPGDIHKPGQVGIVSRSGTLTYETVKQLTQKGFGQSTCVGIGGDPIHGTNFIDVLQAFEADIQTSVIVMIGEIGGEEEEVTASFIKDNISKPVIAFIAGQSAPEGKRMGHAGAVISGGKGTYLSKRRELLAAGVSLSDSIQEIPALVSTFVKPNL